MQTEYDIARMRSDLIDDCYAMYAAAGIGPAILEASDIERMCDEEVIELAVSRGYDLRKY